VRHKPLHASWLRRRIGFDGTRQFEDAIIAGDSEGDIYEDQSVDIDDFILLQQWKETAGIP